MPHILFITIQIIIQLIVYINSEPIPYHTSTENPFHSIADLRIHFHLLDELKTENKIQTLTENSTETKIHTLLQAECLYDYLLTNTRPTHCLPSIKRNVEQFYTQDNSQDHNQSSQIITEFQNHPLLIPLESYQQPNQDIFTELSEFELQQQNERVQKEHNFITSTALPPFGENISLSFGIDLNVKSDSDQFNPQNDNNQEIINFTQFQFELKYQKAAILPTTRIQIVDNSLKPDLKAQSGDGDNNHHKDHVTHLYGVLGSTY